MARSSKLSKAMRRLEATGTKEAAEAVIAELESGHGTAPTREECERNQAGIGTIEPKMPGFLDRRGRVNREGER